MLLLVLAVVIAVLLLPLRLRVAANVDTSANGNPTVLITQYRFPGSEPVRGLEFSRDSRTLAVAGLQGTLTFRDGTTGREIKTVHNLGRIACMCYSPCGKTLALGLAGASVLLVSAPEGTRIRRFHVSHTPCSISFSPDGNRLAIAYGGAEIGDEPGAEIWNPNTGERGRDLAAGAHMAEFSHDGRVLLTGRYRSHYDGAIIAWDTTTWNIKKVLKGHISRTLVAGFTRDNAFAVSGSYDGTARLWDTNTGCQRAKSVRLRSRVSDIAVIGDSKLIVVAAGKTVFLWNTRKNQSSIIEQRDCFTERIACNIEGSLLAIGWDDGLVELRLAPGHSGDPSH